MTRWHHAHPLARTTLTPRPFRRAVLGVVALLWLAAPLRAVAAPAADAESGLAPTIHAAAAAHRSGSADGAPGAHDAAPAAHSAGVAPPADLRHVGDWIAYRSARHLTSLPVEARIFYRRGLMAKQSGQREEALTDVRGAAELDPTYIDPPLTLAAWLLTREPSQALQQYAAAIELLRDDFNLQLALAGNALAILFEALYVGLLFAGLLVVWLRRAELTHVWREELAHVGTRAGARWWATALVIVPFCAGFGLTLPTLGFLGYLWPNVRPRERGAFVALLAVAFLTPAVLGVLERCALPLDEHAAPLYGVSQLEKATYDPAREQQLAGVAQRQPDNAVVQFGLGWLARRGGHLDVAERAYRRATELWPNDDRALTDLGNVLAIERRSDEALVCYQKAVAANPANAAAYFNAAQLHTQRFEYEAATAALARASALNFELVRSWQAQATTDGLLPLIDQWLRPQVFWTALRGAPIPAEMAGTVPPCYRGFTEARGWPFSLLALLIAGLGVGFGFWQHRRLHLRVCSNCERIVCRRCSERRREHALCPTCAALEAKAETLEFGRLLLMRQRQERRRRHRLVHTGLAAMIPGYGHLSHRRIGTPVVLLSVLWLAVRALTLEVPPFAIDPRLTLPGQEVPLPLIVTTIALVYAVSLVGYFRLAELDRQREESLNAAQRGRITQASSRRAYHAAA